VKPPAAEQRRDLVRVEHGESGKDPTAKRSRPSAGATKQAICAAGAIAIVDGRSSCPSSGTDDAIVLGGVCDDSRDGRARRRSDTRGRPTRADRDDLAAARSSPNGTAATASVATSGADPTRPPRRGRRCGLNRCDGLNEKTDRRGGRDQHERHGDRHVPEFTPTWPRLADDRQGRDGRARSTVERERDDR